MAMTDIHGTAGVRRRLAKAKPPRSKPAGTREKSLAWSLARARRHKGLIAGMEPDRLEAALAYDGPIGFGSHDRD